MDIFDTQFAIAAFEKIECEKGPLTARDEVINNSVKRFAVLVRHEIRRNQQLMETRTSYEINLAAVLSGGWLRIMLTVPTVSAADGQLGIPLTAPIRSNNGGMLE